MKNDKKLETVLYTDFVKTETLVQDLLGQKEFKRAVTKSNLYKFWKRAAGEKFADKSKPYSMIGNVMVVACENAVVAQELNLRKAQILTNLEPYLKSLKMHVSDLRFDAKKWINEADKK